MLISGSFQKLFRIQNTSILFFTKVTIIMSYSNRNEAISISTKLSLKKLQNYEVYA